MATSLRFKVIDLNGDLIASVRTVDQALILSKNAGAGARIRHMEWGMLWREGAESPACMSFHEACSMVARRIEYKLAAARAKYDAMGRKARP